MIAPTLLLWLYALAFGIASATASDDRGLPKQADLASSVALSLVIALWVIRDAQKRGRHVCYDYDSFVYFAWPIVAPVYLFQTRGARAFLTLLCFAGICLIAMFPSAVVFLIREFEQ